MAVDQASAPLVESTAFPVEQVAVRLSATCCFAVPLGPGGDDKAAGLFLGVGGLALGTAPAEVTQKRPIMRLAREPPLSRLREDQGKTLGGKRLEFVGIEMKDAALGGSDVGTGQRGRSATVN